MIDDDAPQSEAPSHAPGEPSEGQGLSSRERTRLYRKRKAMGYSVAPVPYNRDIIRWLVQNKWLSPLEAGDRDKVGKAVWHLLVCFSTGLIDSPSGGDTSHQTGPVA